MDEEPGDQSSGLGPQPSGPSFAPWHTAGAAPGGEPARWSRAGPPAAPPPVAPPPVAPPTARPTDVTSRPRADPWPSVLTILAVVVVGLVVVVSSVVAGREAIRPTATRVVAPVSASPLRTDRMEFVSSDGDGVLIVTGRRWTGTGVRPPTSGTYLHVEVELVCASGQVFYGPDNFSAFDASGELFEVTTSGRWGTPLGYGTLWPGESVRGTIAFDLPRGEVTLLLSDSTSRSVTALKIPV